MHSPFVLSKNYVGYHTCQWCAIDSGVAGCVLCGCVHECSFGDCEEVTAVEDCYVCNITGVCLNRYVQPEVDEFMDTTMPCQESIHMNSNDESSFHAMVKTNVVQYIKHLLLSSNAYENWIFENAKKMNYATNCKYDDKCLVSLVESVVVNIQEKKKLFECEFRKKLIKQCEKHIVSLMLQTTNVANLNIRNSEIKNHAIGLLYLMRYGIYVYDVCILPQISQLQKYLPKESNLQKNFGFKAKYITDTENKFKFAFRMMKKKEIEKFIQSTM